MAESNLIRDPRQIAVEMLMTDTDIALLSVTQILEQDDRQARAELLASARQLYEAVRSRQSGVQLSSAEAAFLDCKLERLRSRLRFLGEPV